ncbi:hypothetical protein Sipo8835_24385 [Streptomyces ipomoeae]|jgi:hypothetical protein|uniref:Uncharacterized protein n=1 Tax=Streptomyces ipomoeae TaxID=103232 RepID=A0A540Q1P3_9ACTN|nr:hypothetical protein [Streptomyces ipomoeae]MDX2823045.1 hypothetical protein [Streptomyces ipomoeae]MDX2875773.1 hypothetical protein [Streptomyces ipomoeae]MDX2934253.1 hypothetical protein [Streptomyces ipomoeae]TQE17701.1 hypothetical protein Sipo7851_47135 [Streptomyces ipomoeae]TQE29431.1 hypothetical protein Sipo8835_24385 [Streptomyces ipomoeae]
MQSKSAASALAVGASSLALVMGMAPDAGAVATTSHSKPYSATVSMWSKPLQRCVYVKFTGRIEFKHYYWQMKGAKDHAYTGVKLKDPTMTATNYTSCSGGKRAKLTKLEMTQRWYESTKCKLNASVSGGYPWGVYVAPTVECGKRKAAQRETTYNETLWKYQQSNTGRPAKFDGTVRVSLKKEKLCLSVRPTVTAYVKGKSDSWTKTVKVCVKR